MQAAVSLSVPAARRALCKPAAVFSIDTYRGHGAHKAQLKADRIVQMTDSMAEVVYLASAGTCYMQ